MPIKSSMVAMRLRSSTQRRPMRMASRLGDGALLRIGDAADVPHGDDAHHPPQEFAAAIAGGVLQQAGNVTAAEFGKSRVAAGEVPVLGRGQFALIIVAPQVVELLRKLLPDFAHEREQVALVLAAYISVGRVGEVGEVVEHEVLQHGADVKAHGAVEGELRDR